MPDHQPESPHPSQRRYPPELEQRAVRMVLEAATQGGERLGVIRRVAQQLGVAPPITGSSNRVPSTEIYYVCPSGETTVPQVQSSLGFHLTGLRRRRLISIAHCAWAWAVASGVAAN